MSPKADCFVRSAEARDWPQIRDICCLTGSAGRSIDPARWSFFPEIWIRPYEKLLPDWTLVVARGDEVAGYLTGCPDSASLRIDRFFLSDLPVTWDILRGHHALNADARWFLKRTWRIQASPEKGFGYDRLREWDREYPAHLHINFREEFRGGGWGRKLVHAYFERLRAAKIEGCMLYCGDGPTRFYESLGFHRLGRIEFKPGVPVNAYGRKT